MSWDISGDLFARSEGRTAGGLTGVDGPEDSVFEEGWGKHVSKHYDDGDGHQRTGLTRFGCLSSCPPREPRAWAEPAAAGAMADDAEGETEPPPSRTCAKDRWGWPGALTNA